MSQRAKYIRILVAAAAIASLLTPWPAQSIGQGPGGGLDSIPQSMFGKKKEEREVSGPTLSATDEPVAEIRIVGNKTIPSTHILNQLQTRVGRPFDPALVQRDVRKLAARGWFVDVQPSYEQSEKGRVVIFKVIERPVVRYVMYLGHEQIRRKKLDKETELKVGGPVDPYAVQEARRKLIELYHRSGFNNVQISILEGEKPTDQGIVFVINEGTKQKVWDIEFVGNEFVTGRRLKTKVESKPPTLMIFKGFLDQDQVDGDVQRLTAFYRSFGYFQAKIGRQLVFNDKNTWVTLRFVVHEGPRYQVESVEFIGNKLFSSESLAIGVDLKPDAVDRNAFDRVYHMVKPPPPGTQPFEQAKMNSDTEWLKELYGSQGYVFADIRAEPIFLDEPGKLKLMYHIEEGKRWRVGNIFVHINGDNPHTKVQTALNRLSIRSGEIVDIRELRASERRLQASGLFMSDPVRGIMPKITYQIPELDSEMASGEKSGFRGQSPDGFERGAGSGEQGVRELVPAHGSVPAVGGPPLIAPPQFVGQPQNLGPQQTVAKPIHPAAAHTYKVPPPVKFVERGDEVQIDIFLKTENPVESEVATPPTDQPVSPTAQTHTVMRPPYDDTNYVAPVATVGRPTSNPYQSLTIRTQSPYQPPTQAYAQSTFGGQTVGATGPEARAPGSNQYAVQQAAITEPQLPPRPATAPTLAAPATTASPFGPPPMYAPAQETLPPQYGPPTVYGPGPVPDPRVTPIPPFPTAPYPTDPFTPMMTDPAVDLDVVVSEAQTGRLMLGVAVNSDAGLVGQILLDEQNFDISRPPTSWEEFISGRAWRGGGQRFRLEAAPGTQVHRYLVSFQEPYLWGTDYSLGLSGSFFNRRYDDWDEQRLGGRVSLGYQWTENDLSAAIAYRGEDVKITDPSDPSQPQLAEVLGSNALHGFKFTLANDTRDGAFLATQGHLWQIELEQVIGSFSYPRATLDARQYYLLSERPDHSGRHVLTAATRLGFTGSDTPIYENFFAGGFSTLRGFDFRGANPVSASGVQLGGEFMWVNTLEYLFPLTADDMIHGVAFCDFGTVEEKVEIENFRVAPGFGFRITVPAMGPAPIALDFAFPVLKADFDDTQVFSFNIGLQR